jgi:hypothetical protein
MDPYACAYSSGENYLSIPRPAPLLVLQEASSQPSAFPLILSTEWVFRVSTPVPGMTNPLLFVRDYNFLQPLLSPGFPTLTERGSGFSGCHTRAGFCSDDRQ